MVVREGARRDLAPLIAERFPDSRVVVIADATVADKLGSPVEHAAVLTFAAGEASKSRQTWGTLTDQLLEAGCDRRTVIVALGGGVTTDLAGFVAATFLRGVPWIALPTTTLAMIDAAIGGKTGVNTPAGKNLVGAFHPPAAVFCDPELLATLPDRNFREGLAEAAKHAAALDAAYGEWIVRHGDAIAARETGTLVALIHRSVELKAGVVSDDEREHDRRAVLNAGHTIGHGIELATDYAVAHGEAVAIGLTLETRYAEEHGIAEPGTTERVIALLDALHLPTTTPRGLDHRRAIDAMRRDKKNQAGTVRAALLAAFGSIAADGGMWTRPVDLQSIATLLR